MLRLEQDVFVPLAGNKRLYVYEYKGFWRQIKNAGMPILSFLSLFIVSILLSLFRRFRCRMYRCFSHLFFFIISFSLLYIHFFYLPACVIGASVYCNDLYTKHFANVNPTALAPPRKGIIGNVIIHPTASVDESAVLGPNVTIGAHAIIGRGVRISHSLILDRVEIKDRACVNYAILGWDSVVGGWARVEGIPNQTPHLYVNDKRQGVTIIGRESVVEREVMVRNCIVMPHKVMERSVSNEILL